MSTSHPTGRRRSTKTTSGGALSLAGLLLFFGGKALDEQPITQQDIAFALAALGAGVAGVSARDDNVTSEGTTARGRRSGDGP